MGKYKICVYAICKNEESFVDRWMDAVLEADLVVVTDTGSADATVYKLRARGAAVYIEKFEPFRFDTARNAAMNHIPEDADICVSNDLDEIFEKGWREKLEAAWTPGTTRAKYSFIWAEGSGSTPAKMFTMEKIHCRHGFRWVYPVHERLEYSGGAERIVWVPGLILHHYPDNTKPRGQYLSLLELSVYENPGDDRGMFWLGREYMYHGNYDKSIETLQKFLLIPSTWEEERSAAMRIISQCYQYKGDVREAKLWIYKAVAECMDVREPYLQAARLGYLLCDWPLVLFMVNAALKIKTKTDSYLTEAEAWNYTLYDLGAIACYRLGLYKRSYDYGKAACDMEPDDLRLKNNLELIRMKLDESGERA